MRKIDELVERERETNLKIEGNGYCRTEPSKDQISLWHCMSAITGVKRRSRCFRSKSPLFSSSGDV
jgi:hypothetical protein